MGLVNKYGPTEWYFETCYSEPAYECKAVSYIMHNYFSIHHIHLIPIL